jgi:hypothetical protein
MGWTLAQQLTLGSAQMSEADIENLAAGMGIMMILVGLVVIIFMFFIWGMIFKRAGYSMAMALLMFIPLVNIIWLLVFAFSKWPVQKEVEDLRARMVPGPMYPPAGGYPPPGYPQGYPPQAPAGYR